MPEQVEQQETEEEIELDDAVDVEPPSVKYEIESLYYHLSHFVRSVAEGYQRSMVIEAPHGVGKSYQIEKILTDDVGSRGYIKLAGHSSPLALYQKLQDNKDKVVFLDDCSAVLKDRQSMEIIKAATETEVDSRVVSWNSNAHQLGDQYDEEFEFNGQIIICANDLPDSGNTVEILESLVDRSITYELSFNYRQRMDLVKQVAYVHDTDIPVEERMEIAGWIESVTSESSVEVNLRTLFKCFNQYRYDEERWKTLAAEIINIDPELEFIKNRLEKYADKDHPVKDARVAYEEEFNKSRATFFRKKEKLEENLE